MQLKVISTKQTAILMVLHGLALLFAKLRYFLLSSNNLHVFCYNIHKSRVAMITCPSSSIPFFMLKTSYNQ